MTSIRKAKKLRIGDYKETGYQMKWECEDIIPEHEFDDWADEFLKIVEAHGLFYCGTLHYGKGRGIIFGEKYEKVSKEKLEVVVQGIKDLPYVTLVATQGPFDLNKEKEYPDYSE